MLKANKIAKRKLISENSWMLFMIPVVMNVTHQLPEILSETRQVIRLQNVTWERYLFPGGPH